MQGIDKNSYEVSFIYKGEQVTAYGYLIPAAFNNNNHTDLLFAPIDFKSSNFNFTNILIQLNPKEYDLYPVNSDLVGKPIINIAITDKNTGDLVAWQFPLTGYSKNLTYDNFNISERIEPLVLAANEFYYIKDNMFTLTLTEEEIEQSSTSDVTPKIDVTPLSATNPYYSNWGIPNYVFQSASSSLKKGGSSTDSSIKYAAYSFVRTGTTAIWTHIIVYEVFTTTKPTTTETYNNKTLYISAREVEMKILANSTVSYYQNDYSIVDSLWARLSNPWIEIQKSGSYSNHVVYKNQINANGKKSGSGVLSVLFREVILSNWTLGSIFYNLLQYTGSSSYTIGSTVTFIPDATQQQSHYGKALGSIKFTYDGYLNSVGNYLNQTTTFCDYNNNAYKTTYSVGFNFYVENTGVIN